MFKMPVRRQQSSSTRSNEGFIFLRCGKSPNTVQTSWRPQLPLPKEEQVDANENIENSKYSKSNEIIDDMERLHGKKDRDRERENQLNTSSQLSNVSGGSSGKKWSFGRLFRRKKGIETESSSEEDRKAGFSPSQKYRLSAGSKPSKTKNTKNNRSNKLTGAGFDHVILDPNNSQQHNQYDQHQRQHQKTQNYYPQHIDNEFFLPVETISSQELYYQKQQQQQQQSGHPPSNQLYSRSSNSLDRRHVRGVPPKSRLQNGSTGAKSSSEEELISLHSSTFSKYRSDESIHSGGLAINGNGGQSRRSRAARNERYYKRLSRDGELSHGQVPIMYAPQPNQRWKTQPVPLSIFNGPPSSRQQYTAPTGPRLQQAGSLQHVTPYVQWGQKQQKQQNHQQQLLQQQPPSKNLQNSVNESKRSISYDNHIHLQNINGHQQSKVLPPPPPPRDPLRRVQMTGQCNSHGQLQNCSSSDLRPLSYAFDKNGMPIQVTSGLSNRCVSDDKIWASQLPNHYQSVHSLNMPSSGGVTQAATQRGTGLSRRFITRAERDAHPAKKSLPNGLDFHYIADATPRSRKPIHMIETAQDDEQPPSAGMVRTTKSGLPITSAAKAVGIDFWKSMDKESHRRGRDFERTPIDDALKPRSISSDPLGHTVPVYSEVSKPLNRSRFELAKTSPAAVLSDDAQNVVCGSLHIKPGNDNRNNFVEIRRHKDFNKSSSMPNTYNQKRSSGEITATRNKYDEYVAEKRQQHHKPIFNSPTPLQRKLTLPPETVPPSISRKKPANLEEAINELEAIYKSLGLQEQPEKKERVPTPIEFDKYALAHADEYDEEDSPAGEPDPVRDDVAYRNIQLANLQHKSNEKQPPFGIPIGPIVPSPQTDYLHVTPIGEKVSIAPDIVKDDLAVRALRKDPPGPKEKFVYPSSTLQRKNRATRTQSANIYSLIQRDAAKPSGGDFHSYLELARSIERSGSMSNLNNDVVTTEDVPSTLTLLRSLRAQELEPQAAPLKPISQIPFRHPSLGGAICQLPEKLISPSAEETHKAPVPLPRKSLTPEPANANHQMEDALNKIAKDAQESSVKLSKELQELRKEALITASRTTKAPNAEEERLEKDLREIEAVSEAAKRCGKMLLDTLPDVNEDITDAAKKPRKLYKEGKLIQAIDQVSEAANAVCEKILKDIVTTEPPVIVHEAVKVKNTPQLESLVMPNLIKKLDPIQSEKIEAIAKRCMRQISELAESPDYDNLANQDKSPLVAKESANIASACNKKSSEKIHDVQMSSLAEVAAKTARKPAIEEIDMIMQECEAQIRSQQIQQQKPRDTTQNAIENPTKPTQRCIENDNGNAPKSSDPSTNLTTSSSSSCNAASGGATTAPNTASSNPTSSFSSSSDCLAKSSSPSASRRQSSSITSFNPYSSSDYMKSPSSEYHAPSTDPIKTFSTTSYDVPSTSDTPNVTTNSTFSYSPSPSPPLNLTPVSERKRTAAAATATASSVAPVNVNVNNSVTNDTVIGRSAFDRARSSSPSQYNSSEELAMIFGIEEKPRNKRGILQKQPQQKEEQRHDTEHEQQQQSPATSATATVATTMQNSVSGNVGNNLPNVPLTLTLPQSQPLPQSLSLSLLSSSNHASTSFALPPASTNPSAACKCCYANQDKPTCLYTTKTMTNSTANATNNSIKNNTNMTKPKTNPFTNANRCSCSCSSSSSSSIPKSPSSYKLETILEHQETSEQPNTPVSDSHLEIKLSPNFNRVYASEISIVVDKISQNYESDQLRESATTNRSEESGENNESNLMQCDSLSSLEETSSNPDSGNVSLADYPLLGNERTNVSLNLQATCNSRYEIKNSYVTQVCIDRMDEVTKENEIIELKDPSDNDEFPRLPTAKELADSLKEMNHHEQQSNLQSQNSVIYETPQLNMNISEIRVNYGEVPTVSDNDLLEQIAQCNEEVEKLSQVLKQMPKRRSIDRVGKKLSKKDEHDLTPKQSNDSDIEGVEKRKATLQHDEDFLSMATEHMAETAVRQRITDTVSQTQPQNDEKSRHASSEMSIFGETRPANRASLTTLEHFLMACSLGVISSNDIFTLFLIIIGIVTIIAIVLC